MVKSTMAIVFVGTLPGLEMCALIQTTLPDGALKLFHETGLPGIAVPLGGMTQAVGSEVNVSEQVAVAVLLALSVTSHVSTNVPAWLGVPVMHPVAVLSPQLPGGKI